MLFHKNGIKYFKEENEKIVKNLKEGSVFDYGKARKFVELIREHNDKVLLELAKEDNIFVKYYNMLNKEGIIDSNRIGLNKNFHIHNLDTEIFEIKSLHHAIKGTIEEIIKELANENNQELLRHFETMKALLIKYWDASMKLAGSINMLSREVNEIRERIEKISHTHNNLEANLLDWLKYEDAQGDI